MAVSGRTESKALERFDPDFRECHLGVHATGELVAVDTFFAGTLKKMQKDLRPVS